MALTIEYVLNVCS